jgi:hypothetical protein
MEQRNEAEDSNDTAAQPTEGRARADSSQSSNSPSPSLAVFGFRRLPLKTLYRGIELSAESEEMLDEAMVRLDTDSPDMALKAALAVLLQQHNETET